MDTSRMEGIYQSIGETITKIIPEEWIKVVLYAQVDDGSISVYFYYYPLGREQPEYSLDIIDKWDVPHDEYHQLETSLLFLFDNLRDEFIIQKQQQWTNLTLFLENSGHINIEYDYTNLDESDSYVDHIIWRYKYLGLQPDKSRKRDVKIIQEYLKSIGYQS